MIESLIQDLADQNVSVKVNAVKTLVDMGEPVVEPLIQALMDNNPEVRENAAYALGKIGDERAIDPLIEVLADEQLEVQKAAIDGLANIGEPAVRPLVKIMNDSTKIFPTRQNAIRALGGIGEPAIEPLIQILDSNVAGFDSKAAYYLRVIGEPAVEPLIQALEDDNPRVRARAAEALSGIKDERAIEPLTKALNDEYEQVRTNAKSGLEGIENKGKYGVIATYGKVREFSIEDEKRILLDKLDNIVSGVRGDMGIYIYPDGPVSSYGYNYNGYISVELSEGSEVSKSLMDEIYGIFDRQGMQMGIDDVPVVFKKAVPEICGEAPPDEIYGDVLPEPPATPGFTAITFLMAFLGDL
ncbi:MAG: HEAT repeat domain-containing protein [Methanosarcinaceae archaeon]|nr:HEAT repeat domain-containing protein [Methanosarcinaceae archaeon]